VTSLVITFVRSLYRNYNLPSSLWAHVPSDTRRTFNNGPESFHRHFTTPHHTFIIFGGRDCNVLYHHEWSGHYCSCYYCK